MKTKRWYRKRVEELEQDLDEMEKQRNRLFDESNKWFDEWCQEAEDNSRLMDDNYRLNNRIDELEMELTKKKRSDDYQGSYNVTGV